MSFAYNGSQRSNRLLPLESSEVLSATDRFRLHVLDDEHDTKLHKHVSFYWDQQWGYQYYQRRLLREVRSTRGPVRFVGFPQVRRSHVAGNKVERAAGGNSLSNSATITEREGKCITPGVSTSSLSQSATKSDDSNNVNVDGEESKWAPPRSLAAWNWVRLVAPYERLLCPSLLFSALLSPAISSYTSLLHGTHPPSSSFPSSPGKGIPAHWSTQTCRTLWSLHEAAAAASLPAQEVYVLCAGTLLYLDVVITSGKVWSELEELWGGNLISVNDNGVPTRVSVDGNSSSNSSIPERAESDGALSGDELQSETNALAALQTNLSQPPQSYASLLQHVRILLEALMYAPTVNERGGPVTAFSTSSPQPLLPWLTAAAEAEEWTAATQTRTSARQSFSTTAALSPSPTENPPARHTSAVASVLKLAVREWLSRRGTTVSAAVPIGSRAVALPMRDLCVSRRASSLQQQQGRGCAANTFTARTSHNSVEATAVHTKAQESEYDSNTTSRSNNAAIGVRGDLSTGVPASAASNSTGVLSAFEAFEPHDTPRMQHPFRLPPLPQDPSLLVFTAVWRRTLRRCVQEREVVHLQLRQIILGQAGQRCEELLTAVRQQQQQQQKQSEAEEKQRKAKPRTSLLSEIKQAPLSLRDSAKQSAKGNNAVEEKELSLCSVSSRGSHSSAAPLSSSSPLSSTNAASLSLSPPSQLLLLTTDPAATSFRVLGPRAGEWLTSCAGAWCGFRGELFRCVGNPPPPLLLLPSSPYPSSSGASSLSSVTRVRHRASPSFRSGPEAAPSSAPTAQLLLERFVDGALEMDNIIRGAQLPSASASSSSAVLYTVPVTPEELADRLCRLGAALPRYATEVTGDRLRPADADFVCEVLQQQCLSLFLACKRRGIQQWSLRGWLKGIALTLLDNSGTESRVATPAKLLEMSRQQLTAAMSGTDAADTAGALRMVMNGGLSEVVAFFEHVRKRKDRTVRWLPAKKVDTTSTAAVAGSVAKSTGAVSSPGLVSLSAVEALLLRRAEESAIFSIFQCHPQAVGLSGCGVRRLALHANMHKGSTSLLLARTCGVVVEWDVQDCYEPPRHRRLRMPKRLIKETKKRASTTAGTASFVLGGVLDENDDAPPAEIGNAVERLKLRHVRGMLQYYRRALFSTSTAKAPSAAAAAGATRNVTDAPSIVDSEAQATGTKRLRENDDGNESHSRENLTGAAGTVVKEDMPAVTYEKVDDENEVNASHVKQRAQKGEKRNRAVPEATDHPASHCTASLSWLPQTPKTASNSTTLFPIDRAVALFVLRHHPQYYTQVVGCGIKEVFVSVVSVSATDAGAAADAEVDSRPINFPPGNDSDLLGYASKPTLRHGHRDEATSVTVQSTANSAISSAQSTVSTINNSLKPILVVERICGQRVEVDVEECYDHSVEGCPLRPRVILV